MNANVGYARAVNQGFGMAETPYVFLLNPDIRIQSAAVFRVLRECLEDDAAIAVAGPLQFKEGSGRPHLNFTWSYWTPRAFRIYLDYLLGRVPDHSGPVRVSFLNAGCLFVRRSAFDAVGRLNERYFLYGEEPISSSSCCDSGLSADWCQAHRSHTPGSKVFRAFHH